MTQQSEAMRLVARRPWAKRVAITLIALLTAVSLGLAFIPWQQSVAGAGSVIVYDAMDRPQTIEAPIPARIVDWKVQEGDIVEKGQPLAVLEDIDSKFLDPNQVEKLREQREAIRAGKGAAQSRASEISQQGDELRTSREAAISVAQQRIQQAMGRRRAAAEALRAAEQSFKIAKNVVVQSSGERAAQAADRRRSAEQSLAAAKQNQETARLQRERIAELFANGLRSRRDDELAENELVKARTEVRRAELALEIARRDTTVGNLDQDRATFERERAKTEVERAAAALEIAERDVTTAQLDLTKIMADTAAAINSAGASLQSARETVAKQDADLAKLEVDLQNIERRDDQQVVRAPRRGRIVRLMKVGEGATVKPGDSLAVIAPETANRAVELFVTDNDVPLLKVGRRVRLQFAGWPALQFSGWPSASIGTFGGRVTVIDPVDDGLARYRVVVVPEQHTLPNGESEQPWPTSELLRPGAEATGWIVLDSVPLGFELWRQFNGFPPKVDRPSPTGQKSPLQPKPKVEKK